jgi:hypothetical protein
MNRNRFTKRKCTSSPGGLSVPATQRPHQCSEAEFNSQKSDGKRFPGRLPIKTRVIVSISSDMEFDRRLRVLAMQSGQIVIRVESVDDASRVVDSDCCGIILLDLDSMGRTALEMAGDLLRNPLCPPVILLTGKGEQFDLRMTVFAGSVLEKSTDTFRILKLLKTILEGWSSGAERFPSQRGIIRWEESGDGPPPGVPAKRFWGINE